MAYLFSYGAYALNRVAEIDQDEISNPNRTNYLRSRRSYLPAIVVFCFACGYAIAYLTGLWFFLALLVPLLLALGYTIGSKAMKKLTGASRLKEKLVLKNLVISLGWSLIPLLVGLYYNDVRLILVVLSPFIFLRLFSNTVFFDVRDAVGDRINGLRTIPVAYGSNVSYKLMKLVDFLSAIYVVGAILLSLLPAYSAVMLVLPIYSFVYRSLSLRDLTHLDFLCDVVADGEYIFWGALIFFGKIII
jgi:4-hydroxybenzoate polyprenyltransferase